MADKQVEVSADIKCDAGTLYDMVSDLSKMGQWSPEAKGGRWLGGASGPTTGARFLGHNSKGWRRWSTVATVTAAERGKRFAFHVSFGPLKIADWSYEFTPTGDTTKVTERWEDRRTAWMERLSAPMMGVPDRPGHNRKNMEATLAALKRGAEAK
ncbi:MAG TPA: SRPBCC family protein [Mycobacteriales bacterium]|nr:SRPBCC family protein [Mycobacteriales bacterium]